MITQKIVGERYNHAVWRSEALLFICLLGLITCLQGCAGPRLVPRGSCSALIDTSGADVVKKCYAPDKSETDVNNCIAPFKGPCA